MERPVVLLPTWDPLVRAAVLILASGSFFFSVENFFIYVLREFFATQFKSFNPKLSPAKASDVSVQTISRLVGMLHHVVLIPMALYTVSRIEMRQDRLYSTSQTSELILFISAGFFLHDVIMSAARIQLEGPLYLIHAIACCFGYSYGLYNNCMHYYAACYLLWEISTPFVHLRWVMYKMNLADKPLYMYNALMMLAAFFGCRIVWGTYVTLRFLGDFYGELSKPTPGGLHWSVVAAFIGPCVAINILNYYWFYKMMAVAAKMVSGVKLSEVGGDKDH